MRQFCTYRRVISGVAFGLICLLPAMASAFSDDDSPRLITNIGLSARHWTITTEGSPDLKVKEVRSPLTLRKPLGGNAELSLRAFLGSSSSNEGFVESSIFGLQDVEIGASRLFDSDRWWVGGGIRIPAGGAEIDSDEEITAGVVANRILGLRVKRFGEGMGLFASALRVFSLGGETAASVGAGYLLEGAYDLRTDEAGTTEIHPGDEYFVTAGVGGNSKIGSRWRCDLRYRAFAADEKDGSEVYEEGDQLELLGGADYPIAPGKAVNVSLFMVFKGTGSDVVGYGEGVADSLSSADYLLQNLPGGLVRVDAGYTQAISPTLDLLANAAMSHHGEYSFRKDEPEQRLLGSANVFEVGGGTRIAVQENTSVVIKAAYLTGSAEEGLFDLTGFDLSAALRWTR